MKRCVKCDLEFATPGIQCQSCRDGIAPPQGQPFPAIDPDMAMAIPVLLAGLLNRRARRPINTRENKD
jgi:hypothetical protein